MIKIDFSKGALDWYDGHRYTIPRKNKHQLGRNKFKMDNMVWNGEIYKLTKNRTYIWLY